MPYDGHRTSEVASCLLQSAAVIVPAGNNMDQGEIQ